MGKSFQVLEQVFFVNEVEQAFEIVGDKHKAYIAGGSVYAFFSEDKVEIPLSFDCAIIVLYDRLT